MKRASQFLFAIFAFAIAPVFTGCDNKDDDNDDDAIVTGIKVTENISANTTWESGKVYVLGGRIAVLSGATLTIEPGVIIKGEAGTGANATALLIARGGKIMAEGTASEPIIFTSIADEIVTGEIASPNLDPTLNGLWGGLIVLGNAPISADAASVQIEGIPASDANGLYGGTNATDNSGVIKYVSIRHGGANIGEGNEINGLTLGGVGSGTVIENIEIIANQDDGIEWFGGSVNVTNALVWNAGDDAIDTDQSWGGTLDNFIVITPGDECFELDGAEGTMEATHSIKNGSVKAGVDEDGAPVAEGLADLDDKGVADPSNSHVNMSNVYFFDMVEGQDFDAKPIELTLASIEASFADSSAVTDFFKKGTDAAVTKVATKANTIGANKSKFTGWTMADRKGALADFK